MTDPEQPEVQAPFDAMPAPSEPPASVTSAASAAPAPEKRASFGGRQWFALLALAVIAAGIGQAIGLSLLFDGRASDLSAAHHENSKDVETITGESSPNLVPAPPTAPVATTESPAPVELAPAPKMDAHVLSVGRDRLLQGDVEGARRIAAQYLLRIDGLGHNDAERVPQAYALLGDVLRRDYERSLDRATRANSSNNSQTAPGSSGEKPGFPAEKKGSK